MQHIGENILDPWKVSKYEQNNMKMEKAFKPSMLFGRILMSSQAMLVIFFIPFSFRERLQHCSPLGRQLQ